MMFEGEQIATFHVLVRQCRGELDTPLAMDEEIELVIRAKVVGVELKADSQGLLKRVHEVRASEVFLSEVPESKELEWL